MCGISVIRWIISVSQVCYKYHKCITGMLQEYHKCITGMLQEYHK